MIRNSKLILTLSLMLSLNLVGCGADSGGDRADGVEPGPPPSGGTPVVPPIDPPPKDGYVNVDDITSDDEMNVDAVGISLNTPPTIIFNAIVNETKYVDGITSSNARFTLARLEKNEDFSSGESWVSYINSEEDPICRSQADVDNSANQCTTFTTETDPTLVPDSARIVQDDAALGKVVVMQATSESGGTFTDNEDGTWSYTYTTDIADADTNEMVHRACVQYSYNTDVPNACIDFVPAAVVAAADNVTGTSASDDFYSMYSARKIVTEETCNSCHEDLTLHGSRTQMDYCVTCHNPGSTDGNSGNTVDFKVMVHKIHFAKMLPSVADGGSYKIWGYRNGEHDYTSTSYPQDSMTCARCHAGDEDIEFADVQGLPTPNAMLTMDGHNWASKGTKAACESCHERLFTDNLKLNGDMPTRDHSSYTEKTNCVGCHADGGAENPNSLQANQVHRDYTDETAAVMSLMIESVESTSVGETPVVTFYVMDASGEAVDLTSSEIVCSDVSYDLRIATESVGDYEARISGSGKMADLIANAQPNNRYTVSPSATVGDGANSLVATMDMNFSSDCMDLTAKKVRLDGAVEFAAVVEGADAERREIVDVAQCNDCHGRFLLTSQKHSGTRGVNSILGCVACHNAEYATSDRSREMGLITHGIHASGFREAPHGSYDTDSIQYPGDLADCSSCHVDGSYQLPLSLTRRPIKTTSSTYTTAIAADCAACHDSSLAQSHMTTTGGAVFDVDFDTANQAAESCDVCHGTGKSADVELVHSR